MSQKVAAKLSDLATKVGAIGKEGHNDFQNFDFRGIDQIMGRFSVPLQEVGLVMLPKFQWLQSESVSINGKMARFVTVEGSFTFYDTESDDSLTTTTVGEAADSFDKACNKAMATALKYALLQSCMVPVGDGDMDAASAPRAEVSGTHDVTSTVRVGNATQSSTGTKPKGKINGALFFKCKEAGINSDKLAEEKFGVKSSKELTYEQCRELFDYLDTLPTAVAQTIQNAFPGAVVNDEQF